MWLGNLESYGIPAVIHTMPRFNPKLGDKIQFLEASKMTVSRMVHTVRQVYNFPVEDAQIMRLDLTADVTGVPVNWFRQHVRVKHKQRHRTWGHWTEVSKRIAETITAGDKPNQLRCYDKDGERQYQIEQQRRKLPKELREQCTFENIYGRSPGIVTRVERQAGARSPARLWGLKYFGEISQVASKRPFDNMVFPDAAMPPDYVGLEMSGTDLPAALYFLDFCKEHGMQNTINQMKRLLPRRTFFRKYRLFVEFIQQNMQQESAGITLDALTEEFRTSTLVQLAA